MEVQGEVRHGGYTKLTSFCQDNLPYFCMTRVGVDYIFRLQKLLFEDPFYKHKYYGTIISISNNLWRLLEVYFRYINF